LAELLKWIIGALGLQTVVIIVAIVGANHYDRSVPTLICPQLPQDERAPRSAAKCAHAQHLRPDQA
jgi:hypothetical protein